MAVKPPKHIENRMPPGQTYTEKWPVLHEGNPLQFDPQTWKLNVHGCVEKPQTFTWEEFQAWPKTQVKSDFHCVTRWSKFDNEWAGTLFKIFVNMVKPTAEAKFVRFVDHQGYDTSTPLDICMQDDVVFATHHNGKVISPEHGGPMRVVIPKLYAWKSCKWVVEVEFLAQDRLGYWEVRGYSNNADPFKEERFA